MKAAVDSDSCTACGLCAGSCPQVFVMGESCAEVIAEPVPPAFQDAAREAAVDCPVDAISVEE